MPDMNQIEIPQSFMALFVTAGRRKPSASLEVVVGRYELCEDMACLLTEHAQTMLSNLSLTEEDVLLRCHDGLMAGASVFTEQESEWVIRRLGELLAWTPLELGEAASPYSGRTA
jgi:hypothetical protein